mgnify:CR=1 FL=1
MAPGLPPGAERAAGADLLGALGDPEAGLADDAERGHRQQRLERHQVQHVVGQFVEPPMASSTRIAFSKDRGVSTWSIVSRALNASRAMIAIFAAVGQFPSLRNYYDDPKYARDDYRSIVRFIDANARDGDGICQEADRCPDDPEDYDGFEDTDGCPDPDNDQDGVLDVDDH